VKKAFAEFIGTFALLGPAIVGVGSNRGALGQVWLFIVASLIGGGIAGLLFQRGGVLSAES
jgi:aquaporin Z